MKFGGMIKMSSTILLKKTCSIYASDLHLATMIFPYVKNQLREGAMVKTILENNIGSSIETVISHISLNPETEEKMKQIDWAKTNILKIRNTLQEIEMALQEKDNVNIIVSGSNLFIDKVNQVIDLWIKANLETIEEDKKMVHVINCYHFEQNQPIEDIMEKHEYILKTTGIEEIIEEEYLKKAN